MADIHLSSESMARIKATMIRAGLKDGDFTESFVRGTGSGGQKVDKTSSCVQLRHAASGTMVKCQRTRSREANRWLARRELAERLLERRAGEVSARRQEAERIRRQKRRRSRRQQARMLDDKRKQGVKKALRRAVDHDA